MAVTGRGDHGEEGSRRPSCSSSSGRGYEPIPDCYYGLPIRLTSITSGLARIALASWCIYLEVESIRQRNYYAYQKFPLFWGDVLVLISTPFAIKAGIWVNRVSLQAHSLLSSVACLGPAVQLSIAAISFPLDGHGIDTEEKYVPSYRSGGHQKVYPGNNADPSLAKLIVVISSVQLALLCVGVGIHSRSLTSNHSNKESRLRLRLNRQLSLGEPVSISNRSSPVRPFYCYISRGRASSQGAAQISMLQESPRLSRIAPERRRLQRDEGSESEDEAAGTGQTLTDPPPSYYEVMSKTSG